MTKWQNWWKISEDCSRYRKSQNVKDNAAYTLAKNVARAEVAKAQEAGRKEFGDMLDKADGEGQVFKVAKQIVRRNKDVVGVTCIKDKNGNTYYRSSADKVSMERVL